MCLENSIVKPTSYPNDQMGLVQVMQGKKGLEGWQKKTQVLQEKWHATHLKLKQAL